MNSRNHIGPLLTNSFGDRYLYEINGAAFDKIGAEASFDSHFGDDLFVENSLYIIVGTDSGLLPKHLVDRGLPEGSYYIFIELPGVIKFLEKQYGTDPFHKKIRVTTASDWLSVAEEFEYKNFIYLGQLKFSLSFAAMDGRCSDYFDISAPLQEELEKIRWSLNAELGSEVFLQRQLDNLPENRNSAAILRGSFSGKTAIVLGGGPSLDAVIPWIVQHRDQLTVVAVSRIARRLLEVELFPDLIVSVDPNPISFDISKEMLALWEKTIFVHQYHVVGSLPGQWCGRNLFFGSRFPWPSELDQDAMHAPGPTVTNSAIDLCVQMGFEKVLLAGVDLCHSREGYTHAQGSNERLSGPQLGRGQLWVETNGGWLAETTPDFHFAATQISSQAAQAKENHCQIINLGESSARMEDVDFLPCSQVDLSENPCSAFRKIMEILPEDTAATRTAYYEDVLMELVKAQKAFRDIRKLSGDALKANAAFFGRRGSDQGNRKYKLKMDRIEKELKEDFSDFSLLVKRVGIREFLRMTQGDQDRVWDQDDAERLGRIYYEAYRDSSARLLKMVEQAANRLRTRLEEEKESPDFGKVLQQWSSDGQPGRTLVWKTLHPHTAVSDKFTGRFAELEQTFSELMEQKETAHLQRTRSWSELGQVRGKLQRMYKQQQSERLTHLVDGLEKQSGSEALSLSYLGKGYLAELNGDEDAALSEYQKLIDLPEEELKGSILEDALKRLLSLLLKRNDQENAHIVSECLASISVAYLPFHADLLWLLGEKRTALDFYADYLELVPDDHAVMIKLGRRYLEIDLVDGAKMMFEAVLEKDAAHSAAKSLLSGIERTEKGDS